MKKIILLIVLSFIACSKSDADSTEKQLTPNYQNMVGDWVYTTVIKADGSQAPYVHSCSTNKDFAHIIANTKITSYYYNPFCTEQEYNCNGYYFEGIKIMSCFNDFNEARVTSLTSTTMRLDYDQDKAFGSLTYYARGLILKKR
ncbi:Lipocalin-like domain-containing protein [Flavobacterium branchiophilum]|uniref:Lipocalin-like domain-containing protein n=2 Tax=Flavobacterium branchiophilum TaxID=55197 RepID=A0A2H3KVA4_9FLAO|nr:hypothetical protein [Flavobacterium branchiophilum]PDS22573.1 hypothetical protein B0A77_13075 [Flavobacterium branchiophilum]CCB68516.1 Hypothetical lipoprotein precursor [Flavobacterium branchiophilum FL-15]